jgi:hypothetical protein
VTETDGRAVEKLRSEPFVDSLSQTPQTSFGGTVMVRNETPDQPQCTMVVVAGAPLISSP